MGDSTVPAAAQPVVYVTGFGPFGNHPVNASWEAVRLLTEGSLGPDIQLLTQEIPVEYDAIKTVVPEIWTTYKPLLVVHVGVSGVAQQLTLEQLAHNDGYNKLDVLNCQPEGDCCVAGGQSQLQTCVDMAAVCEAVNRHTESSGVEAVVSEDPGRYLCDFIYYTSLHHLYDKTCSVHTSQGQSADPPLPTAHAGQPADQQLSTAEPPLPTQPTDPPLPARCGSRQQGCAVFIHVPPLDKPYSAPQLAAGIILSIQSMLQQLRAAHSE